MVEQPTYEVIKKEDLMAAFADAMATSNAELAEKIDHLVDLYAATAPSSVWVWDYTSRFDYDIWG